MRLHTLFLLNATHAFIRFHILSHSFITHHCIMLLFDLIFCYCPCPSSGGGDLCRLWAAVAT